jgi:hypothetical protein
VIFLSNYFHIGIKLVLELIVKADFMLVAAGAGFSGKIHSPTLIWTNETNHIITSGFWLASL